MVLPCLLGACGPAGGRHTVEGEGCDSTERKGCKICLGLGTVPELVTFELETRGME